MHLIPPRGGWKAPILFVPCAVAGLCAVDAYRDRHPATSWARSLGRDDVRSRREAALELCLLGEKAVEAVPALRPALKDRDKFVRATSAAALGRVGEGALPAVPELVEALGDADWAVRAAAAEALGRIGPAAGVAAARVLAGPVLRDTDVRVRLAAAEALAVVASRVEGAAREMSGALASEPDGGVRRAVLRALSLARPRPPRLCRLLVESASDPDPRVRRFAVGELGQSVLEALSRNAFQDDEAIRLAEPVLRAAFADSDPVIRKEAIGPVIYLCNSYPPEDVQGTADSVALLLKDADPRVRTTAAGAMHNLICLPPSSLSRVAEALRDDLPAVRRFAASTLDLWASKPLRPDSPQFAPLVEATPHFCDALEDSDAFVRYKTFHALVAIAPHRTSADPELERRLRGAVRRFCADLRSESAPTRIAAASGLVIADVSHDPLVVKALRAAATEHDPGFRHLCEKALKRMTRSSAPGPRPPARDKKPVPPLPAVPEPAS